MRGKIDEMDKKIKGVDESQFQTLDELKSHMASLQSQVHILEFQLQQSARKSGNSPSKHGRSVDAT